MNFCPCCAALVSVVTVFSSALVLSLVSFPICPILINISSAFSPRIYTRIWHLPLIFDSLVLVCHSSWVVCMSALTTVTFNPSPSPDVLSDPWHSSPPPFPPPSEESEISCSRNNYMSIICLVNDKRWCRGLAVPREPFSELSVTHLTFPAASLSVLNFSVTGRMTLLSLLVVPRDGWWKQDHH